MRRDCKNLAFTLAEVLITLGIIGVVAVLTLPTLVNKVQEDALAAQVKKTHSTIMQGLEKAISDGNAVNFKETRLYRRCFSETADAALCSTELRKYFKTSKNANLSDEYDHAALTMSCSDAEYTKCTGPVYDDSFSRSLKGNMFVLEDGTQLFIQNDLLIFDVNAKKAPNAWGKDIFGYQFFGCTDRIFRGDPYCMLDYGPTPAPKIQHISANGWKLP